MDLRDVSMEEVLFILATSRRQPGSESGTTEQAARVNRRRVTVVTDSGTGKVITVYVDR